MILPIPIKLIPKTVNTWIININDSIHKIEMLKRVISEDEKEKASKFRFKKDQNQFIIARGVLRVLSANYLGIAAEKIIFKYGKYGKPDFDFDTNLKFNISHSGDLITIGFVKDFDIGIDIEQMKDDFDVLEIASNYFSELEIETLKNSPKEKHVEYFYRCWTRKESFIKAKSLGLTFPLDSFSVCINSDKKTELLETKWDDSEKHNWKLFTFSPQQNYIGAISILGDVKTVEYFNFNGD